MMRNVYLILFCHNNPRSIPHEKTGVLRKDEEGECMSEELGSSMCSRIGTNLTKRVSSLTASAFEIKGTIIEWVVIGYKFKRSHEPDVLNAWTIRI